MTRRLVAAIETGDVAEAVLSTALALGRLLDLQVTAVHATDPDRPDSARDAAEIAGSRGVPLTTRDGEAVDVVTGELAAEDTVLGVCGCRAHRLGPRPGGHVALGLLTGVDVPIVMVPPGFVGWPGDAPRRVVAPLDGTATASETVRGWLTTLSSAGVEVVVVHVFDASTVPAFLDQTHYGLEAWAGEFLSRRSEPGYQMRVRTGDPAEQIAAAAADLEGDLLVVGWSRELSPGRAETLRGLLGHVGLPILVVPDRTGEPAATVGR